MDLMDNNSFEWCGYRWKASMEGGRIIHPDTPWYWCSLDTINICENNILELNIRENPREVKYWDGKIYKPIIEAATLRSIEDFSYGTFSASIILPSGNNLWPSFWTSGSGNWPPEIDIMEAWSYNNGYFKWLIPQFPYISPSWKTTTNVHYRDADLKIASVGSRNVSWFKQHKDPTSDYIDYKCIWHPDSITFLVNDKIVRKITGDVCKNLTKNINNPEKGFRMNVIFNIWCENPSKYSVNLYTPMKIKDFRYEPYTIYYTPRCRSL